MKKIRVLFFGATAAIVGSHEATATIEEDDSPAGVLERLVASHPELSSRKLHFAVNEEYVSGDSRLNDGDELAIFTQVSGG